MVTFPLVNEIVPSLATVILEPIFTPPFVVELAVGKLYVPGGTAHSPLLFKNLVVSVPIAGPLVIVLAPLNLAI